jgi:uncharacterized protein
MVEPAAPPPIQTPPPHWFSWWGRLRYFVVHSILHAADSPHRIALGVAIGLFIALLPLVGVQMVLAAVACHPFKANKAVAVALAWVSNPVTLIPIYLPMYWFGCVMLGLDAIPYEAFVAIFFPAEGGFVASLWATYTAMLDIFVPLWLGSTVVAVALSVPGYFITLRGVTAYRMRRYGTVDLASLKLDPVHQAKLHAKAAGDP